MGGDVSFQLGGEREVFGHVQMAAFEGVGAARFRPWAAFLAFFCCGDGGPEDFDCVGGREDRIEVGGQLLHGLGLLSVDSDDETSGLEGRGGWTGVRERWRDFGQDADLVEGFDGHDHRFDGLGLRRVAGHRCVLERGQSQRGVWRVCDRIRTRRRAHGESWRIHEIWARERLPPSRKGVRG